MTDTIKLYVELTKVDSTFDVDNFLDSFKYLSNGVKLSRKILDAHKLENIEVKSGYIKGAEGNYGKFKEALIHDKVNQEDLVYLVK